MSSSPLLAPGIPPDYYRRIAAVEAAHWWYRGMREIGAALLGDRLLRPGTRLLDAGCGTGGFLRWTLDRASPADVAGVDIAEAAIALARERVPEADLHAAPLRALPFEDASFDLVVSHDVLQHVPEDEVAMSLGELRRVLAPEGTLLLRTNGARKLRRERADWRAYDRATLAGELEEAGLRCERMTYANMLLSLYGAARGRVPRAPTPDTDGLPRRRPSVFVSTVGGTVLWLESKYLARGRRTLPYGHTLFAVASRPS